MYEKSVLLRTFDTNLHYRQAKVKGILIQEKQDMCRRNIISSKFIYSLIIRQ